MSIFATMLYTYSIWQKSPKIYKILGVPSGITWIVYGIYIKSFFAVVLECVLLIATIIGIRGEYKTEAKTKKLIKKV